MYDPLTGNLDFSQALVSLRQGQRVARRKWLANVYLVIDDDEILMANSNSKYHWMVSPKDLLAEDWYELI